MTSDSENDSRKLSITATNMAESNPILVAGIKRDADSVQVKGKILTRGQYGASVAYFGVTN